MALCCEYRVMVDKFTIGLVETTAGFLTPHWLGVAMANVIGQREAEVALTTGRLFKTDEAFRIGLIDEIVPNKDVGVQRAEVFLDNFSKIDPTSRARTKKLLREKYIRVNTPYKSERNKNWLKFSRFRTWKTTLRTILKHSGLC